MMRSFSCRTEQEPTFKNYITQSVLAAPILFAGVFGAPATADAALVLANDPAGNGFVSGITLDGFTLTGSDFLPEAPEAGFSSTTSYTEIAASSIQVTFDWSFANSDNAGTFYDIGGYIVGDVLYVISDLFSSSSSGTGETFAVAAGQVYGWAVYTQDALNGSGVLTVSGITVTEVPTGTPEPGTVALLAAGIAGLGWARRRTTAPSL
jgi:hypothetical protein